MQGVGGVDRAISGRSAQLSVHAISTDAQILMQQALAIVRATLR